MSSLEISSLEMSSLEISSLEMSSLEISSLEISSLEISSLATALPHPGVQKQAGRETSRVPRRFNEATGLLLPANGPRLHPRTGWSSRARRLPCGGNGPRPATDGGAAPP